MDPAQRLPNPPIPSATVILARQKNTTIEVYLLRRNPASRSFPGFYVFPGGILETDDKDTSFWLSHVDCANHQLTHRLGGKAAQVLPFAVAAIRETFEEAGLLPASSASGRAGSKWPVRNQGVFSRQIARYDLQLSASKLGRWCRWITSDRLESDVLPPHAPFSRLWLHQGVLAARRPRKMAVMKSETRTYSRFKLIFSSLATNT